MADFLYLLASGTYVPPLARLEQDDDRIAVCRDVLATTNGGKIKASDVHQAIERAAPSEWSEL